jgi:hypothetical protein
MTEQRRSPSPSGRKTQGKIPGGRVTTVILDPETRAMADAEIERSKTTLGALVRRALRLLLAGTGSP